MGDVNGNLYCIEGDAGAQDSGSVDITTRWTSKLYKLSQMMSANGVKGYVSSRSGQDTEITMRMLYAGSYVSNATCTVPLTGSTAGEYVR